MFRSYTNVNNYNNFLKELDNKQQNKEDFVEDKLTNRIINSNIEINDVNLFQERDDLISKPRQKVVIQKDVKSISDLLDIIKEHPNDKNIEYNIDINALHKIKDPLIELNSMIGLNQLKSNILDQLLFYLQGLHTCTQNDYMHTVIYGNPGTGKTEIAKILGQIFAKLGILKKGTFKKVTRSDLIAGYLGQTSIKTREVIEEALGGVLFIDEAYSLGNEEKRDSFAKECIDTLCEALSNYKHDIMVIIAGYERELNNCFFGYNQGLQSRFTWRFKTDDYTPADMYNIFVKKVTESGWNIQTNSSISEQWFAKNIDNFVYYGRDIEVLFSKTKIAHSRRVFCLDHNLKKHLLVSDLNKGLEMFLSNAGTHIAERKRAKELRDSIYS